MKRRIFLKRSLATGTAAVAVGAGLLSPIRILAATWPEAAFTAKTEADALSAFFGSANAQESGDVTLKAPLQAENGAVVPIKIMTSLTDVEAIAVVVVKNPSPYTTSMQVVSAAAGGMYSARIKMGQTSPVNCYVKAGGKVYMTSQEIKVTVGGCGG
jgi:sulfur-oxidizing protein SoxY